MNRFKNYVKMSLLMLAMLVALSTVASAVAPTFLSATATNDTNIDIVFNQPISIMGTPDWATAVTATYMTATGGSATSYTLHVTVNSVANTAYTATDLTILAGTVKNALNDQNAGITDQFIADGQAPTVTITSAAINPTKVYPIPMTATFSEDVYNFVESDIVVVNGSTDYFDPLNGTTYTFNVNPDVEGAVTVDIDAGVASDVPGNDNTAAAQFRITYDETSPDITLVGTSPINIEVGSVYTDAGATALDNLDGYINGSIIVGGLPVNTAVLGAYTVTYDVTDDAGNHALQVTRTVNVVDTTPPVITLNGVNPVWVVVGSVYTDAGATALDNVDGDITGLIDPVNTVNTAVSGTYTVTYNVTDDAGNHAAMKTRTVNVVDLDLENSTVEAVPAVPAIVIEDGRSVSTITVTAKNNINQGVIPGASVVLTSSSASTIISPANTTNAIGQAKFTVSSYEPGTVELTAKVLGKELNHKAVVTFGFDNKLRLNKGWNLVSVPRKLANSSVSALNTTKVDTIYYYDTGSGGWKSADYTNGNWSGDLKEIKDGNGYWMNATESTDVPVVLKLIEDPLQSFPPSYLLKAGWNMVGYTSVNLNLNTGIDSYFFGMPWITAYEYTGSGFKQARSYYGGDLEKVSRTKGYWLYLSRDGTLVP